ncbi:hypothetical protein TCDM_11722 [Trypanosoma cruzi Dm28c]|uniref:Mucin TcMUCII n=1 Tax=Trypanosoma cruzi Dm28c TaxID=1416333 RepID=V5AJB8_TRYCR|nr:hypothetical protein TCDM_11722 [Trypanosoma cruzi Dm28c]
MDQALPPPPHHDCLGLLIPDGPRETPPHSLRECPRRWELGMRLFVTAPVRTTEYLPLLYGRPLRYSLVIVAAYNQNRITICFVMNIGCASRGPTIRMVCEDILFLLLLCFCVAVCAAPPLVCVYPPCGVPTRRTALAVCKCGGALCAAPVCFSLFHVCVGVAAGLCVCVLPWIGVCVVRGVRRTVHAWLLPSPHVVCPLCVSAAPLVSPVALHFPHCADQLHTTERPHSR